MKKSLYMLISAFVIIGCGGGGSVGSVDKSKSYYKSSKKTFNIYNSNQIVKVSKTGNSEITLNVNSPKDIYVVVTSHFNNQKISISSPSATADIESNSRVKNSSNEEKFYKIPLTVLNFKAPPTVDSDIEHKRIINKSYKLTEEGDTFNFCMDIKSEYDYSCKRYVQSTAKKVIKNISTPYGNKNLVVWVEDDVYKDSMLPSGYITQDMVDKLADTFLKEGSDNDIYNWDTNIYGEEWGDDASEIKKNLILNNNTINILISTIYDKNGNDDTIAGYFHKKDNYKSTYVEASNEKIMFYINSKLYQSDEKETFTTLAHEFQHMIHFYQREIKLGLIDSTWFNEMMSETTEDLVATKIEYHGPRNVDYRDGTAGYSGNRGGRYPNFNKYNYLSLTNWGNSVVDYSKVSSFGAFLLRNYGGSSGGAKVLHDMMYSTSSNENAVLDATGESSFESLLNKWAEGVILSDVDDLDNSKPRYNFGDFKNTTYGGITYKLGSINFFNYSPKPSMNSSKTLNKDANLYYKVGSNLSGKVKIDVNIEKGGDVIIIAK